MKQFFQEKISFFENRKQSIIYWLLSLFGVIVLRMYIEDYSAGTLGSRGFFNPANQIHEFLFYIVVFSGLAVLLSFFTKERVARIVKIIVTFSPIILVAPIIDLIITGGKGLYLSYIFNFDIQSFWVRFATLGGTWEGGGATPGMKIELVFIFVFIFLYVWIKTNKKLLGVVSSFIAYCSLVIIAVLPLWVEWYYNTFGITEDINHTVIGNKIFLLLIIVFGTVLFGRYKWTTLRVVIRSLRIFRIIFYLLLFAMGLVLAQDSIFRSTETPDHIVNIILGALSICFTSIFLMMVNDQEDIEVDKISNPTRILPSGKMGMREYKVIGVASLCIALLLSIAVSLEIFYLILLGNVLFIMYSTPPFKLKNVFGLSKAVIASAAVVVMTIGYLIGNSHCSGFLPIPILTSLFIAVFVSSHLIDLKDHQGDGPTGRKTLPVLIGDRNARIVISLLILGSFIGITFILGWGSYALYSAFVALMVAASLFKKPYNERIVFIMLFLSLIYFSVLYLIQ